MSNTQEFILKLLEDFRGILSLPVVGVIITAFIAGVHVKQPDYMKKKDGTDTDTTK